jgi:hypothetical protein
MNPQKQQAISALNTLLETVAILRAALSEEDDNKAHEAVSVLLTQAMTFYGADHPVFQQFFPVLDTIKRRIDAMQLEDALCQAELFDGQLREVQTIITNA